MEEELDKLLKALEEGDTYADFVKQRILNLFVGMPRWISVNDELPKKLPSGQYITVLVVYNGKVATASWLFGKFCLSHNGCSDIQPTHWSYMPEPPNGA